MYCPLCKQRNHPVQRCPALASLLFPEKQLSEDFFGPSPNIFVGRYGYPNVFTGPLAASDLSENTDSPDKWFGKSFSEILKLRSTLVRSKNLQNIYSGSRFIDNVQEISLACKPTAVEMIFAKKPVYSITMSNVVSPMGPSVELKKLVIAENPHILQKVERIVSDDLRASEQAILLYKAGQDVYKITTILSAGALGLEKKLVPTRWSITATDDIIGKEMLKEIRTFPAINDYLVFSSNYLGNHFEILFMPGKWEYENFEAWAHGSHWHGYGEILQEYEPFSGRTTYADKIAGGYYAARIACIEFLHRMRKQATVIVFREISEEYTISVGVWVIRETVRHAFNSKPKKFSSLEESLSHLKTKLTIPMARYRSISRILQQRKLSDFI